MDVPIFVQDALRILADAGETTESKEAAKAAVVAFLETGNLKDNLLEFIGSALEVVQIQGQGMTSASPLQVDGAAKVFNITPHFSVFGAGRIVTLNLTSDPNIQIVGKTTSLSADITGEINMDVETFQGAGPHGGPGDLWIITLGRPSSTTLPVGQVSQENAGWGTNMHTENAAVSPGNRGAGLEGVGVSWSRKVVGLLHNPHVPSVERRVYLVSKDLATGDPAIGDFAGQEGKWAIERVAEADWVFETPVLGQYTVDESTGSRYEYQATTVTDSPAWAGSSWRTVSGARSWGVVQLVDGANVLTLEDIQAGRVFVATGFTAQRVVSWPVLPAGMVGSDLIIVNDSDTWSLSAEPDSGFIDGAPADLIPPRQSRNLVASASNLWHSKSRETRPTVEFLGIASRTLTVDETAASEFTLISRTDGIPGGTPAIGLDNPVLDELHRKVTVIVELGSTIGADLSSAGSTIDNNGGTTAMVAGESRVLERFPGRPGWFTTASHNSP